MTPQGFSRATGGAGLGPRDREGGMRSPRLQCCSGPKVHSPEPQTSFLPLLSVFSRMRGLLLPQPSPALCPGRGGPCPHPWEQIQWGEGLRAPRLGKRAGGGTVRFTALSWLGRDQGIAVALWRGPTWGSALLCPSDCQSQLLSVPQGLGTDLTLLKALKPPCACIVDAGRRHETLRSETHSRKQASCFVRSPCPPSLRVT